MLVTVLPQTNPDSVLLTMQVARESIQSPVFPTLRTEATSFCFGGVGINITLGCSMDASLQAGKLWRGSPGRMLLKKLNNTREGQFSADSARPS